MYSKIVNPSTGRKVNISSRLGRKILKNYLQVLKGGASGASGAASRRSSSRLRGKSPVARVATKAASNPSDKYKKIKDSEGT